MATISPRQKHRLGGWMPADHAQIRKWLHRTVHRVRDSPKTELAHPSVVALADFIECNPDVRALFNMMLQQVPQVPPYNQDPTGKWEIETVEELLLVFDEQLTRGPVWLYNTENQKGLIGFPFNAILDWPMGTPAGIFAFLRPDINKHLKAMLDAYGEFLMSSKSTHVLTKDPDGWFNDAALQFMVNVAAPPPQPQPLTFADIFVCDPSKPSFGYKSWDDFFTRQFVKGRRPVAGADDPNVIVNCCESGPLALVHDLPARGDFWTKGQPYSLEEILGSPTDAAPYVGGTLYQAFLSALSYHCWHAPTSGKVKKIVQIPGTYYAENYWEGFAAEPDPSAPNNSQPYICQVATRSVMFLESDNPAIGEMAIVPIGMAEVSSCEWKVKEGDRITKGQLVGMFHFGGSTHLLLFRRGVKVEFVQAAKPPYPDHENNIPLCSKLATVVPHVHEST